MSHTRSKLNFGGIQISSFELLPDDILLDLIVPQLDDRSLVVTKTASRRLYGFYKPEDRKRLIKKLFEHAVNATAEDIQEIRRILNAPLKSTPRNLDYLRELLCATDTVKDTSGRVHKDRTLFQIFLGARDYDLHGVVDGSADMLVEDYFSQLPDGEQLSLEQCHGQFPKGFEEKEKLRAENESRELNKVLKVVRETSDADCQQTMALDSFHGIDLRSAEVIQDEIQFLASAIYLNQEEAGLNCRYRGLDGQLKTKLISWNKLPPCGYSVDTVIKNKYQYVSAILGQIAEPGEFYTAEQIEHLKTLSNKIVTASEENFENAWVELQEYLINIVGPFIIINFNLLKTLYQFRNFLEPKEVYTTGYHSNPELLREAGELYYDNFVLFGNDWSSPKNVLCAEKIVGLAQRGLTACELQIMAQGHENVLGNWGEKSRRSFLFTHCGGLSIAPLDSDRIYRLGYNCLAEGGELGFKWRSVGVWTNYAQQIQQRSKDIAARAYAEICSNQIGELHDNVNRANNF